MSRSFSRTEEVLELEIVEGERDVVVVVLMSEDFVVGMEAAKRIFRVRNLGKNERGPIGWRVVGSRGIWLMNPVMLVYGMCLEWESECVFGGLKIED